MDITVRLIDTVKLKVFIENQIPIIRFKIIMIKEWNFVFGSLSELVTNFEKH